MALVLRVFRNALNIEGTVEPNGLCVVSITVGDVVVIIISGTGKVDIEPPFVVVEGGVVVL